LREGRHPSPASLLSLNLWTLSENSLTFSDPQETGISDLQVKVLALRKASTSERGRLAQDLGKMAERLVVEALKKVSPLPPIRLEAGPDFVLGRVYIEVKSSVSRDRLEIAVRDAFDSYADAYEPLIVIGILWGKNAWIFLPDGRKYRLTRENLLRVLGEFGLDLEVV